MLDDRLRAVGRALIESVSTEQVGEDYEALKAEYERRTSSPQASRRFDELIASLDGDGARPAPRRVATNPLAPEETSTYVSTRVRRGEAGPISAGPSPSLGAPGKTALLYAVRDQADFGKGRRIVGELRRTLANELVRRYTAGESIRVLSLSTGRSYGFIHRLLIESGVQLRQRGGARRRKKA